MGCEVSKIRELSRQMVRELGLIESPHASLEVSPGQLHALLELSQQKRLGVGELASILNVDKSVSSRLVSSLEEKGWVVSAESREDSRRKVLSLTPQGVAKVKQINEYCNDLTSEALRSMSLSEQLSLQKSLAAYVEALRRVRTSRAAVLRPLRKSDEALISKIVQSADGEFQIRRTTNISSSSFKTFREKGGFYIVAELNGKVCGGGGIAPRRGSSVADCELQMLYLKKDARGLGIGQRLLEECLSTARHLGYRSCYASTSDRFKAAFRLYEANGFRRVSTDSQSSACNRLYLKELS